MRAQTEHQMKDYEFYHHCIKPYNNITVQFDSEYEYENIHDWISASGYHWMFPDQELQVKNRGYMMLAYAPHYQTYSVWYQPDAYYNSIRWVILKSGYMRSIGNKHYAKKEGGLIYHSGAKIEGF